MNFTVERWSERGWELKAVALADDARQAVARGAEDPGLYRARPLGTRGLEEHFSLPEWGPPEPVERGLPRR